MELLFKKLNGNNKSNINIKEITNPNFKNILKNTNLPETNKPCSQPLKSAEKISEPMNRISDNIHNKYLKVKSLLSPEKFQSFENVLNKKERDPQKVNVALDKLLAKIDPFDISDGYKVISEVKNKIVGVADQIRNLKEIASSPIKGSATYLTRKLAGIINVLNSSNNNGINDQNFTDSNQVRTIASISAFTGFGNCGELAALAAVEARKLKFGKIEFFSVQYSNNEQNNHIFLVVNREEGSDNENPKTWGNKALIIDPWREKVYKALDYNKNDEKKS